MQENLMQVINYGRNYFDEMVSNALGENANKGACLFGCFYLKTLILNFCKDTEVFYRGGDGINDGGYIDASGQSHGHYWLEVVSNEESYIVDITADQFDGDKVVVIPTSEAKQYISGNQDLVDSHACEFEVEIMS